MLYALSSFLKLVLLFFHFFIPSSIQSSVVVKPIFSNLKAIYVTAYSAGDKSKFGELIDLVKKTELNAMVVDVKDYTGRVFIKTGNPIMHKIGSIKQNYNQIKLIKTLKDNKIHSIARISTFQDPYLAEKMPEMALRTSSGRIWRDYKGLSWVDPSRKEVWKYNVDIAKAAIHLGFDEVNFDYIRFPSDGDLSQIDYKFAKNGLTKNEVMANFFRYVNRELRYYPIITSVDLFGMTLWKSSGLGIGQRFEDAVDKFDYIYPMVYPSHFPENFEGYENPADHPYEIVYNSLDKQRKFLSGRLTQMRPWIQDFDIGAVYDAVKIRDQMRAATDAGVDGWLIWNASNRYTADALLLEKN